MTQRSILHVDMDAFFVSVELLDQPELRGKPVIVGGNGPRGVVAAASYEARAFGVFSAMSSVRARHLCPQAVFLAGRYHRYTETSEQVMSIFSRFTPLVEPLSLDEAFLDVTGSLRLHGPAPEIALKIRRRVLDELGLTCSVGVAPTKFVAKLASEAAKPKATPTGPKFGTGVRVISREELVPFIWSLPVQALWGVGPSTLAKLQRLGVHSVADLAALPLDHVVRALGAGQGRHLHSLANGDDDRDVVPNRAAKSVGHEETFAHDLFESAAIDRELVRMTDAVAGRLRQHDLGGRTVTVKVRYPDFRTITRSATQPEPVNTAMELLTTSRTLVASVDVSPGVRLLGVHVSGLSTGGPRQLQLGLTLDAEGADGGTAAPTASWLDASDAIDEIRNRFGDDAIGPAVLLGETGLRRKRRGDQQWGPSHPPKTED